MHRMTQYLIYFVLLTFLGQGFAASAHSCLMTMDNHVNHISMNETSTVTAMPHGDHMSMPAMNRADQFMSSSSMDFDCCKTSCHCTLGGCSIAFLLTNPPKIYNVLASRTSFADNRLSAIQAFPLSLYRPPIFA